MVLIITINGVILLACKVYEVIGASQFFVKKLEQLDQLGALIIVLLFLIDTIATIGLAASKREPKNDQVL